MSPHTTTPVIPQTRCVSEQEMDSDERSRSPEIVTHPPSSAAVEEGVEVLEVPIIGCPVTTMEVSVKWRNKGNTQKSVSNGKTREYACTNSF